MNTIGNTIGNNVGNTIGNNIVVRDVNSWEKAHCLFITRVKEIKGKHRQRKNYKKKKLLKLEKIIRNTRPHPYKNENHPTCPASRL